jgi:sugar phosphate isomerase/epimerase
MQLLQTYFEKSLRRKVTGVLGIPISEFRKEVALKLLERLKRVKLYAHTYAFFLNFKHGCFDINDLIEFAYQEGLDGISAHIDSGEARSLRQKTPSELSEIKSCAQRLGLGINLEISSTSREEVNCAVRIARMLDVKNIRVYIRYGGRLSKIIRKGVEDLKAISKIADENDLHFVLEQHEDLKSHELVDIITRVNSPRIGLLFDFGNMVNAYEEPLAALHTMSPHIRQVHLKGIRRINKGPGFAHLGMQEGEDDLPQMKMLFDLLMLGDHELQVKTFSLEQTIGYYAPAYRLKDEGPDPEIPERGPSETFLDKNIPLKDSLLKEKRSSCNQIRFVRNLLEQLKTISEIQLSFEE